MIFYSLTKFLQIKFTITIKYNVDKFTILNFFS